MTKYFLSKKFVIFQKKILTIESERWGKSNKSHLGGVAFFFNIFLVFIYFFNEYNIFEISNITPEIKKLLGLGFALTFAFFAGLVDEIEVLPPLTKVIIQILSALFLIWGKVLIPLTGFLWFDSIITIFFLIFVTNIVNIFDNIDMGLAPVSVLILSFFLILGGIDFKDFEDLLLIYFICALIVFIFYNYSPSKLFMGDSGSFQIGILISYFLIENILNLNLYSFENLQNIFNNILIITLIISLLLYDFCFVFINRIIAKKNPFRGDTNHISHKLDKKFKNANFVGLIFTIIQALGLMISFFLIFYEIEFPNLVAIIFFYHVSNIALLYFLIKK